MQDLSPSEMEAIVKTLGSTAIEMSSLKSKIEQGEGEPVSSFSSQRKLEGNKPNIAKVQFMQLEEELRGIAVQGESMQNIKIEVNAVLGRAKLPLKKLLEIQAGSVIPLDKLAGEPVEIEANGSLIGWGEVVVVDDKFGVRVTQVKIEGEKQEI